MDKEHADKLADRLARITGERPDIVHSDAADASARIARFSSGSAPWLVSVLMVSEGVDVPRLRVGVYATTARTELFFRQVIGRFIRRTPAPKVQMSHVFLPSDPRLKKLAVEVEEERNHALDLGPVGEQVAERGERGETGEAFRALSSSARRDDEVLQTTQPGDALQLFAEPAPPTASPALAAFTTTPAAAVGSVEPETAFEKRERLRAERSTLVGVIARKTGEAHRTINARVNREVGAVSVDKSTDEQLEKANRLLEKEVAPPAMNELPSWPAGTVAVLSTGAGEPHAIPVSTAVRRGPRELAFALSLRRESLARLRADPRCALTLLSAGVSVTALGRAFVEAELRARRGAAARGRAHPGPRAPDVRDRRGRPLALDRRGRRARRRRGPRRRCEPAARRGLRLRRDAAERGARVGRVGGLDRRDPPGAVRGDRRDRRGPPSPPARARALFAGFDLRRAFAERAAAGVPRHEELYDVYPDAAAALARLRAAGVRVGIAGNQPAGAERSVAPVVAAGDLVATSAAWGVSKPDPAFFARLLAELALPAAAVAYVGDRVDNDVLPAAAAGLFTVHLRRGPWGVIQAAWPEAATADVSAANLDEAVDRDPRAPEPAATARDGTTPTRFRHPSRETVDVSTIPLTVNGLAVEAPRGAVRGRTRGPTALPPPTRRERHRRDRRC